MNPAEQQNEYSDQNKRADALFDGVCAPGVSAQEEFLPDVDLQQSVNKSQQKRFDFNIAACVSVI